VDKTQLTSPASEAAIADGTVPSASPEAKAKPAPRKGKLIEVSVDDIVVEGRFRAHPGDVAGLARSIEEHGLLQPPIVDAGTRLVCGYRRVLAARHLGWKRIPVIVLDIEDPLLATVAEDRDRKPLLASEKFAVTEALRQRAADPEWRRRAVGGLLEVAASKGRLDEAIARHVGLSRESLRKIRALHLRAEEDEARFGDLPRLLDEDGRVDRHYRELQRRLGRGDQEAVSAIVVSPGWADLLGERTDLTKLAKGLGLAAKGDRGCLLAVPSPVRASSEAAAFVSGSGFRWALTAEGRGNAEAIWLVGVLGRGAAVPKEIARALSASTEWSVESMTRALTDQAGPPTLIDLAKIASPVVR